MSITIIPISPAGLEALRKAQEEKRALPRHKRKHYEKLIREEREGDNITLSYVKKNFNALVSGDYLEFMIKDIMGKNGALFNEDYILKTENKNNEVEK